tara:strand:+ start:34 stop:711 length:678 start_codon:yes stop_codon:yes gene_type:complete
MSNISLSLVLFDFDGTLCDSATTIVRQMRRACADIGMEAPAPELVRANIGLGVEHVAHLYTGNNPEKSAQLAVRYRALSAEEYMSSNAPLDSLYDGAGDALITLSDAGYLIGITTNKGRAGLTSLLERHELTSLLDVTVTPNETTAKPAPDMVIEAMRRVGVEKHRCVLVGDTRTDAGCARNAGIQFIAVSWGYNTPEILHAEGAVAVLSDFSDLLETVSTVLPA